jgi:ADP-ribose pyrophosphatase
MKFDVIHSDLVYQGRVFGVERVQVRLPNGRESVYDLVRHRGAVTIVPVDDMGNILFVRQYRLGAEKLLLELPAGVLEVDEDPAFGAAREIREETGQAAGKLEPLGTFYMAPGYSSEYMHIFLARGLYLDPLEADADEFLQVVAVPIEEAYRMAEHGEILDGKTLASLLLARSYLQK